jgi:alpha-1,3/alpha-1,6-mannosyltransferase
VLCAILRQLHLILKICIFSNELQQLRPTAFLVDQLSAGVPLLRLLYPSPRILFYCHFPDKLLASRRSIIKRVYRIPFDWVESWSTGCSDGIVVNSKFTRGIFKQAFPSLKNVTPAVIYPCVDTTTSKENIDEQPPWKGKKFVLSINRFERKKDVGLAIEAFCRVSEEVRRKSRLVIAGRRFMDRFH